MEKPLFPSKYIRITQGYDEGSHKDSYAIDNADIDGNKSDIYAPFTGIIKKIYQNDANEVWLESSDKVEYPDGTIDYLTVMFAHCDDVSNLFVGKEIKKDETFYKEGTKGNATGNHCHVECGKGKFTGSGWHKNSSGYWSINNGKKPEECFWIDDSITTLDSHNYTFKSVSTNSVENSNNTSSENIDSKEENISIDNTTTNSSTETVEKVILTYTAPKTDLYGIYLKENELLTVQSNQE